MELQTDRITKSPGQVSYTQSMISAHLREKPQMDDRETCSCLLKLLDHPDSEETEGGWEKVLRHKVWMSQTLGHDVPTVVALLDYIPYSNNGSRDSQLTENQFLERLAQSMVADELTQIYNRRFFDEFLRREVKRAQRYNLTLSLLILDLDDFKTCNDRFGHPFGDRVLAGVGSLLKETVREVDLPCRYGGEEFVIVLPETSAQSALVVAERVRRTVEQSEFPVDGSSDSLSITVSGGVSSFSNHGNTPDELMQRADSALYRAKHEGKNRICFSRQNV